MVKSSKFAVIFLLSFVLLSSFSAGVKAQFQDFEFSGNSKESYQCFDPYTGKPTTDLVSDVKRNGYWLCKCNGEIDSDPATRPDPDPRSGKCGDASDVCGGDDEIRPEPGTPGCLAQQAALRPPKLHQLEVWFVRVVYVVWGLIGSLAFVYLLVLAYKYTISRGDVTKITEIRQKIIYYFIGLILVFLAVPILTTIFRVMGIDNSVKCYDVFQEETLGFQFFFSDLCTDPDGTIGTNPCQAVGEFYQDRISSGQNFIQAILGGIRDVGTVACANNGDRGQCPLGGGCMISTCVNNVWTLRAGSGADCI